MNPETIEAIQEALTPVANKIGEGGEYGWQVIVAGQFAEGVGVLIISATLFLAIFGIVYLTLLYERNADSYDKGMGFVFGGTFGLVGAGLACSLLYEGLLKTLAPEYSAIKFLLSIVS